MADQTRQGLIQVYTGDGKGKTTAALGLSFRALGRGFKVAVFQFMKPAESSGEHFSAQKFGDQLTIRPVGRKKFILKKPPAEEDIRLARDGLNQAAGIMAAGQVDLLVLDEVNVALLLGLLQVGEVLEVIEAKPPRVELVLTGRGAPPEIIERADLVTEMKLIKHPYEQGVEARQGIEF